LPGRHFVVRSTRPDRPPVEPFGGTSTPLAWRFFTSSTEIDHTEAIAATSVSSVYRSGASDDRLQRTTEAAAEAPFICE
jgi:hypothetical protein